MKSITLDFIRRTKKMELVYQSGLGSNIVIMSDVIRVLEEFEVALLKEVERQNDEHYEYPGL